MKKFLKNHKGVTMVEVLLTVAMLAIVVAPCLSAFVVAQRGNVLAKQTFDSYTVAANLIEELKAIQTPADEDWGALTTTAIKDFNDKHSEVSAFSAFASDEKYCIVEVYEGDYETVPADVDPILKGVITP